MKGSNAKKEALTELSSDKDFLLHINFLLNPYVKTGISSSKIKKKFEPTDSESFNTTNEVIEYLSTNFTGRDKDIVVVQKSIKNIAESKEEEKFLEDFFTKKLRLGFTGNTVNKIIPNFIPIFSPMLAEGLGKIKDLTKSFGDGYVATLKLDGIRCTAIKRSQEDITLFTRQGKEIVGVSELTNFYKNPSIPQGVYDGEILAVRKENETTDELFRRTVQLVNSHTEATGLQHILFDMISLSEWDTGKFVASYNTRRVYLEGIFDEIDYSKGMVGYLPTIYAGKDLSMIPKLLDEYSDLGYEGIMINTKNGKYANKRTKDLVKAKKFDSADLLVTGGAEGQGRLEGLLGVVTVDYKGYSVDVGSGFTDEERKLYFENPELIVGKIIEVKFQSESQDMEGKLSLRFPIFKGVRLDKTVEDIRYSDNQ